MVKRIISLTILLLAGFIMLAHDVVPHHHHEDTVCFTHQSCSDHQDHEHELPLQQSDTTDECCPLGVKLIYTVNPNTIECPGCVSEEKPFKFNNFFLTASVTPLLYLFNPLPYRQHPPVTEGCPKRVSLSYGLRAPPAIQG